MPPSTVKVEDNVKRILTDGLAPTHISIADSDAGNSKDCGPSDTPLLYLKVKVIPDGGASKGAACSVSLALVEKAKITRNKKDSDGISMDRRKRRQTRRQHQRNYRSAG